MIIRDAHGKLFIVNRKDCKNDASYYEKIYEIKKSFVTKFQSHIKEKEKSQRYSKQFSNNIQHEDEDE